MSNTIIKSASASKCKGKTTYNRNFGASAEGSNLIDSPQEKLNLRLQNIKKILLMRAKTDRQIKLLKIEFCLSRFLK